MDEMAKKMEAEYDLHRNSERKSKRLEADFLDLEERLRKYESEMAAGDMMRDGLRTDKERVSQKLNWSSKGICQK